MEIIWWIAFGALAGSLARLVMPGPRAGGMGVAVALGIGSALIGGFLCLLLDQRGLVDFDARSVLMAVIAALCMLLSYRSFAMRFAA
jgi:uncharacterized membrane protein YeaQ/YmgE (transglycosylase-associated protein family)